MYDRFFVESLTPDELLEVSGGESQYPITCELLEAFTDVFVDDPILPALLGRAIGTPGIGEEVLEWIARFAEEQHDHDLWLLAVTDADASLERALTAPPDEMAVHSSHCFVWKYSLKSARLWTTDEWQRYRTLFDAPRHERSRFSSMAELVEYVMRQSDNCA